MGTCNAGLKIKKRLSLYFGAFYFFEQPTFKADLFSVNLDGIYFAAFKFHFLFSNFCIPSLSEQAESVWSHSGNQNLFCTIPCSHSLFPIGYICFSVRYSVEEGIALEGCKWIGAKVALSVFLCQQDKYASVNMTEFLHYHHPIHVEQPQGLLKGSKKQEDSNLCEN